MELNAAQQAMLEATVALPDHVVLRHFEEESIALNLETGKYHGLNVTAGRMVQALSKGATVGEVAKRTAAEYGRPPEQIQTDILQLCADLSERGLIDLSRGGGD